MKIALCISGYLRTFKATHFNLKEHLFKKYPEIDIFIHTWNKLDYANNSDLDISELNNLYNPKKIIIENSFNLPQTEIMVRKNPEKLRVINNVLSMFYKIKKCNDLKSQYEIENNFKYDCVIRFRSDINLHNFPVINQNDLDKISIPEFGDFSGLNDQFAFSNSENMDKYSLLYNKITEYLEKDTTYLCMKPELLLKYHLNEIKINLLRPNILYDILRSKTEILNNEKREREFGYIK